MLWSACCRPFSLSLSLSLFFFVCFLTKRLVPAACIWISIRGFFRLKSEPLERDSAPLSALSSVHLHILIRSAPSIISLGCRPSLPRTQTKLLLFSPRPAPRSVFPSTLSSFRRVVLQPQFVKLLRRRGGYANRSGVRTITRGHHTGNDIANIMCKWPTPGDLLSLTL